MARPHQLGSGVLTMLLDFSFTEFLTLKVVRALYVLAIGGAGILALLIAYAGFQRSFLSGLGGLLVAAVLFLVVVVLVRIWLEATVVFFRVADNTAEIAEQAAAISVNTGKQDAHSRMV